MSPHSRNYLLIFLFLTTIITASIAWQYQSKVADLQATVQQYSRELAQARAQAARINRPTPVIANADVTQVDPSQPVTRGRRGGTNATNGANGTNGGGRRGTANGTNGGGGYAGGG